MLSDRCLSLCLSVLSCHVLSVCPVCNVGVLWPNGDEMSECSTALFDSYVKNCEDMINCIKTKQQFVVVAASSETVTGEW